MGMKRRKGRAPSQLYPTPEAARAAYRQSPARFFERYQESFLSERELISPEWAWFEAKYHYNLVENGIIDLLRENRHLVTGLEVLDVGSGTGHWVDFYRDWLEARAVVGVDFSAVSTGGLAERYRGADGVEIRQLDVTAHQPRLVNRFDVVNAIGVMFHIIDDQKWALTIANLLDYLRPDGIAIVGGDFRDRTEDLGAMRRVRSLETWRWTVAEHGGAICGLKLFDWWKGGINPGLKNSLLAFRRA
jgi:SAM-dependent methyltransferase